MNLSQLQTEHAQWADRNFPNTPPYQPLLGAMEELGELSHAHLKAEQNIRGTPQEHHAAKVDAIGDILIYLAHYCTLNGIALGDAAERTWAQVSKRDWQANRADGQPLKTPQDASEDLGGYGDTPQAPKAAGQAQSESQIGYITDTLDQPGFHPARWQWQFRRCFGGAQTKELAIRDIATLGATRARIITTNGACEFDIIEPPHED